jgi:hypothetical protein
VQEAFTKKQGVKLYGEVSATARLVGSEAICHNKVIEDIALPGQLVDRHRQPHVHGGRARLLRVRRRLDRHGERLVHEGRPRRRAGVGALQPARPLREASPRRT